MFGKEIYDFYKLEFDKMVLEVWNKILIEGFKYKETNVFRT